MLDTGHLDRVLQELLVLLFHVNRHGMKVVELKALVGRRMLVLDIVMMLRFGNLFVVLPVVDDSGETNRKQCHKNLYQWRANKSRVR